MRAQISLLFLCLRHLLPPQYPIPRESLQTFGAADVQNCSRGPFEPFPSPHASSRPDTERRLRGAESLFHHLPLLGTMTLYERRSSMESWDRDRWRDQSPTGSQRRKLSFNPVGTWVPPNVQEEPVAAFEVSRAKRIAQVAVAVVYCLLAAGVVFGYAAIKPVLIEEGVYRDKCTKEELDSGVWVCYEQELR